MISHENRKTDKIFIFFDQMPNLLECYYAYKNLVVNFNNNWYFAKDNPLMKRMAQIFEINSWKGRIFFDPNHRRKCLYF